MIEVIYGSKVMESLLYMLIDTIDEGMEILTGIKAGELNESGEYKKKVLLMLMYKKN